MCECVKKFNDLLLPKNGKIATAIQVTAENSLRVRICVATEKVDTSKRKPLPTVVATFCPFCGIKLD